MAISIGINGTLALDESIGLQGLPLNVTDTEDDNDNDVLLSSLQSSVPVFYNRLFNDAGSGGHGLSTSFPSTIGVAHSASNFISLSGTGSVTALGFVGGSGSAIPVLGSAAGLLTDLSAVDGGAISLFADPVLGNRMVLGVDADGDVVFAIYMQPNQTLTAASVSMVLFEPLSHPDSSKHDDAVDLLDYLDVAASASTEFNFDALPSGQNLFGMVGDASSGLIVIGKNPLLNADGTYTNPGSDTINTSQGGGPTTIGVNNQMFDPGDGAYFTYVKNPDPDVTSLALDANEADNAENIQFNQRLEVDGGFVKIAQIQGNSAASLTIKAFNGDNALEGASFASTGAGGGLGTGSVVSITKIVVKNASGAIVQTLNNPTANADGSYTVSGLGAGYRVEWTTNGVHDQVLISGTAGKFDIGGFGVNEPAAARADIGDRLIFEDDGPSVTIDLRQGAEVRVDESRSENANETEIGSLGSVTVTAAVLFSETASFGQDGQANSNPAAYSLSLSNSGADSLLDDTASGQNVLLYVDGNDIVGKTATGGDVVFRIAINASTGAVTLTQYRAMVHGNTSDHDEANTPLSLGSGLVSAVRTLIDGDGDSASDGADIGPALKFEDDGPSVTIDLKQGAEVRVDESRTQNLGETEMGSLGSVTVSAALLYDETASFGQDGEANSNAAVYSLSLSSAGADSLLDDTASGQNVLLYTDGNDIVGKTATGGEVVFRIAIDASTGAVTLTQYRAMVHGNTSDHDEANAPLSLGSGLVSAVRTLVDGDGDSDSDYADIGPALKFEDDGPSIGLISDGIVDFAANSSVTKALNGVVGVDGKTNPYTLTAFTSSITVNGVELKGVASGTTQVGYWADTNGDTVFGNAGDTEYYRMALGDQSGAGNYTFTVLLDPPPALLEFDFTDLPSGQNLMGIIAADKTDLSMGGILVMPSNPDIDLGGMMTNDSGTVNTSKGGGPVTIGNGNQAFDNAGEGAVFVYVDNPKASAVGGLGLTQTSADDADTIEFNGTIEVTAASVEIVQASGAGTTRRPGPAMEITAYDLDPQTVGAPSDPDVETGSRYLLTDPTATGVQANIIGVKIYDSTGKLIEYRINAEAGATNGGVLQDSEDAGTGVSGPGGSDDPLVDIQFRLDDSGAAGTADDIYSVIVSNLQANYTVEWITEGVHDAAVVEHVSGSYDIGGFNLLEAQPTLDQLLEFTARVTDGDGDTATDSWSVGIDGTGPNDDGAVTGVTPVAMTDLQPLALDELQLMHELRLDYMQRDYFL